MKTSGMEYNIIDMDFTMGMRSRGLVLPNIHPQILLLHGPQRNSVNQLQDP